jgi:hypothetical protein
MPPVSTLTTLCFHKQKFALRKLTVHSQATYQISQSLQNQPFPVLVGFRFCSRSRSANSSESTAVPVGMVRRNRSGATSTSRSHLIFRIYRLGPIRITLSPGKTSTSSTGLRLETTRSAAVAALTIARERSELIAAS